MKSILTSIGLMWFVTFWSFWMSSVYLGGDAVNGKTEGGRFYPSWHGKLTEVSRATYDCSYAHAVIVLVMTLLTIVANVVGKAFAAKDSSWKYAQTEKKWRSRTMILMMAVAIAYAIFRPGL